MNTDIGITDKNRKAVATQLSRLLADEFILYTKTRKAHWNIEGKDFHSMHVFFESQYEQLDEVMDSVAERIRQLGHYAPATLQEFLSLTRLTEKSGAKNDSQGFIRELLADHESIIIFLRENIKEGPLVKIDDARFDPMWDAAGQLGLPVFKIGRAHV